MKLSESYTFEVYKRVIEQDERQRVRAPHVHSDRYAIPIRIAYFYVDVCW